MRARQLLELRGEPLNVRSITQVSVKPLMVAREDGEDGRTGCRLLNAFRRAPSSNAGTGFSLRSGGGLPEYSRLRSIAVWTNIMLLLFPKNRIAVGLSFICCRLLISVWWAMTSSSEGSRSSGCVGCTGGCVRIEGPAGHASPGRAALSPPARVSAIQASLSSRPPSS